MNQLQIKDRTSIDETYKALMEYLDNQKPTPCLIQFPDPVYPLFDRQPLSTEQLEKYAEMAEKMREIAMKYDVAIEMVKYDEPKPMDMASVSEGGKAVMHPPIFDLRMSIKDQKPQEFIMIKSRRSKNE